MAKTNALFSAVIVGCILVVHAESPVVSFPNVVNTENDGYDYSSSIKNDAYNLASKPEGNGGESFPSTISYNGRLNYQNSVNSGFQGYSSSARGNFVKNPSYSLNGYPSSSFGIKFGNGNGADSTFEGYATGANPSGSSGFNQLSSSSYKSFSYPGYSDDISDAGPTEGSFRGVYSSFRGPAIAGGGKGGSGSGSDYFENDHSATTAKSSYSVNGGINEYSQYGKHKVGVFGIGASNTYGNDVYSSPSDMRFIRGSLQQQQQQHMGRDYYGMYLTSPLPFTSRNVYGPGKANKYGKYFGDYNINFGYPQSKDQESDYSSGSYNKAVGGKVIIIKGGRPASSSGQGGYSNGNGLSSYIGKMITSGSYKSKPTSFVTSNLGYSSMSSLPNSFTTGNYNADGHLPRGYQSTNGYGSGTVYPGYY